MGKIVLEAFMTLDGVVQSGGAPDEDRDAGFPYGGWATSYDERMDEHNELNTLIATWERDIAALLLGRTTYEIFAGSWGAWDENADGINGELTRLYNHIPKYVASRSLTELDWKRSYLLGSDVPAAVTKLRAEVDGEIRVWGSTQLIATLAAHELVDEYRLMIYPILFGTGKKLFHDGYPFATLALAESRTLRSGVVINIYYRRDEQPRSNPRRSAHP